MKLKEIAEITFVGAVTLTFAGLTLATTLRCAEQLFALSVRPDRTGALPHADEPTLITRNPTTGIITHEAWRKDGALHRTDGPAYIERDATTAATIYASWWHHGRPIPAPTAAAGPMPGRTAPTPQP